MKRMKRHIDANSSEERTMGLRKDLKGGRRIKEKRKIINQDKMRETHESDKEEMRIHRQLTIIY